MRSEQLRAVDRIRAELGYPPRGDIEQLSLSDGAADTDRATHIRAIEAVGFAVEVHSRGDLRIRRSRPCPQGNGQIIGRCGCHPQRRAIRSTNNGATSQAQCLGARHLGKPPNPRRVLSSDDATYTDTRRANGQRLNPAAQRRRIGRRRSRRISHGCRLFTRGDGRLVSHGHGEAARAALVAYDNAGPGGCRPRDRVANHQSGGVVAKLDPSAIDHQVAAQRQRGGSLSRHVRRAIEQDVHVLTKQAIAAPHMAIVRIEVLPFELALRRGENTRLWIIDAQTVSSGPCVDEDAIGRLCRRARNERHAQPSQQRQAQALAPLQAQHSTCQPQHGADALAQRSDGRLRRLSGACARRDKAVGGNATTRSRREKGLHNALTCWFMIGCGRR
ncbi:Uncharacterised protein [Achromobacter xylosoxidans]|nr:Uncharacterised protein [Achromobacter xylosoxidans]